MRTLILLAAALQVALGGYSVRMPFLNPAGVTYVNGPSPVGLAAGPLAAGPLAAPFVNQYAAGLQYAPLATAAPYAAAPLHAPYAAAPLQASYAAAPLHYKAAVPVVHHVPGVADVPVTKLETQHGVVQQLVDVHRPAVSSRTIQVRRPAIEKQFYDIEERIVVRPAGSALVELEQPHSKVQTGPARISPAVHAAPLVHQSPVVHAAPIVHAAPGLAVRAGLPAFPAYGGAFFGAPSGVFGPAQGIAVSSTPAPLPPQQVPSGPGPAQGPFPGALNDDESVVIDNPDFARSRLPQGLQQRRGPLPESQGQGIEISNRGAPLPGPGPVGPGPIGPALARQAVPTLRNLSPELSQANQLRLIELLTARGGVNELALPGGVRSGPSQGPVDTAVRARVLSATPAPSYAEPAGERVSTRRIVVNRPTETVENVDVFEPVTKLERVAVNQPTVFKTLRQGVARVPTSVPVLGKALAPAYGPGLHYAAGHGLSLAGGYY